MIIPGPSKSKPTSWDFYTNILMPATRMFRDVHQEGFVIDFDRLDALDFELTNRLVASVESLHKIAGHEFLPTSPQQVAVVMFDEIGLHPVKRRSTDIEVLETLMERSPHDFVRGIMAHRKLAKLHGTYVKGIGKNIRADQRLHPEFLVTGAVSRTSSRNPNTQNIPRGGTDEDEGAIIKECFIAPLGWQIAEFDYSQHEFRQVAIYSQDDWLTQVYLDDGDMHGEAAIAQFGPDYTDEHRVRIKARNFGLLYGMGAPSLANSTDTSVAEAQESIDAFYDRMPEVRTWFNAVRAAVLGGEDLVTEQGRHRRFGLITRQNVEDILKQARNFHPQASGSDSALMGMHEVWDKMDSEVIKPVGFVHDSMQAYIREDVLDEVVHRAADLMIVGAKRTTDSRVPFKVEVKVGDNWGKMKEFDLAA